MNSPLRGDMSVLDDGVVEVPVEALLDVGHILDLGDAAHRDLSASSCPCPRPGRSSCLTTTALSLVNESSNVMKSENW